jgi:hypothetical protein
MIDRLKGFEPSHLGTRRQTKNGKVFDAAGTAEAAIDMSTR